MLSDGSRPPTKCANLTTQRAHTITYAQACIQALKHATPTPPTPTYTATHAPCYCAQGVTYTQCALHRHHTSRHPLTSHCAVAMLTQSHMQTQCACTMHAQKHPYPHPLNHPNKQTHHTLCTVCIAQALHQQPPSHLTLSVATSCGSSMDPEAVTSPPWFIISTKGTNMRTPTPPVRAALANVRECTTCVRRGCMWRGQA